MIVADKVRKLARDIITTYVHHVYHKVRDKDSKYIESGIDGNLFLYEELFIDTVGILLGRKYISEKFSQELVLDCVGVLDTMLADHKYTKTVEKYHEAVYDSCALLFNKVERGLRERGTL